MSPVDAVALAKKLEALLSEHRVLSSRMREVGDEAKAIFDQMDNEFGFVPPRRTAPARPRPLDDRISISVGRTIAVAQRHGWDPAKTTVVAVTKAAEIARKHGVEALSSEILSRIDRKVSRRLQTAA